MPPPNPVDSRSRGREPGSAGLDARPVRPGQLLDDVRTALRVRHYSRRTEKSYVGWIRRFILFHGKTHPREMGSREVTAFLADLAERGRVSASTQNQALSALLFLYRVVLETQLTGLDAIPRAKRVQRLPVVLGREGVRAVLGELRGMNRFTD